MAKTSGKQRANILFPQRAFADLSKSSQKVNTIISSTTLVQKSRMHLFYYGN